MKQRLDRLVVERGLFASRKQAQGAIMAGNVYVDGRRVDKPGAPVAATARVEVRGDLCPYVSRGGLKLARALEVFGVDPHGAVALDVGASTGGFTDCLLQHGAKRVYAVDVGYGQLDWRLRQDPRVVVMERTNARYLQPGDLPEPVDIAVIDVSFISLEKVLPAVAPIIRPGGTLVALVKPQFEAGPEQVGKGGVVRDPAVHRAVLVRVADAMPHSGLRPLAMTHSPIKGPRGNIEYFILARRDWAALDGAGWERRAREAVQAAWAALSPR
ncbi:MAG: TlyA family RNA methyltransferase [Firmicutes bacterium]|nr:TlyA family RNA methyltransferase [Bacillota bacterium]